MVALGAGFFVIAVLMVASDWVWPGSAKKIGQIFEDHNVVFGAVIFSLFVVYASYRIIQWMRRKHEERGEALKQQFLAKIKKKRLGQRSET
jgi:hypothetical protein